uniref:Uncharacterized protein n=1 Tax=Nelumbo nucifera TaxID=4432 RepID=A0A822Y663_NELNU|nr:TPA_asm: hypothetical protein HUJ06_028287 [Nelumbo nucifera]
MKEGSYQVRWAGYKFIQNNVAKSICLVLESIINLEVGTYHCKLFGTLLEALVF